MSPRKSCWSFAFALVMGVSSLLGGNANAGVLRFESEVTVLAGSSVGAGIFMSDTAVKFTGLFDPASTVDAVIYGYTPFTSLQIKIGTLGTFDAVTPGGFGVISVNPLFFGSPVIGIVNPVVSGGYYGLFATTSQPYDYAALAPNVFSDHLGSDSSTLTIALAGGAGDFTFVVSSTEPVTASISVVPEPTSMAVFGLGSLLVVARRVRRARQVA